MGLFGAIGRETKGAFRSLGYDLRTSRRFRRIGAITVAAVAGGVIATGALIREPVPGLVGLGDEESDITGGWFGMGADTTGQEAESATSEAASRSADAPEPDASTTSPVEARGKTLGEAPGLLPVDEDPSTPPREEEGEVSPSPTQEPTEQEPTPEPTTDAPTTAVPTTEEPTSEAPTTDPSPSASLTPTQGPTSEADPTSGPPAESSALQARRVPPAPIPRKGPIGG